MTKYYKYFPKSVYLVTKDFGDYHERVSNYDFNYGVEVHSNTRANPFQSDSVEITEAQYNRLRILAMAKLNTPTAEEVAQGIKDSLEAICDDYKQKHIL